MDRSEITGKVAGKAKSMGKAMAGYSGIFRRLAEEHEEVAAMLKRVAASDEGAEVRRELFPTIRKELLSHARAEEKEFYSVLRSRSQTKEIVEHSLKEHREVERMLDELHAGDPSTPEWTDTVRELKEAVAHHVKEEENELFPRAKDLLEVGEAERIEANYASSKKAEMARVQ